MEATFLNYVRNLNIPERNVYSLDWGAVAIRDCDNNGDLLKFKNVKSFKEYGKTMWITLKLARFREDNQIYGEYICPECPSMKAMLSMCVNVNKQEIQNHLCLHSRAAKLLLGDWKEQWPTLSELHSTTISDQILLNSEKKVMLPLRTKDFFLAAFQEEGKISLLYSLTRAQKRPFCTQCTRQQCVCFKKYKSILNDILMEENEEETENGETADNVYDLPWKRETLSRKKLVNNYQNTFTYNDYIKEFGFNQTHIKFPLYHDNERLQKWLLRRNTNEYILPDHIIPDISDSLSCLHGNRYDADNNNLIKHSDTIKIYTKNTEFIRQVTLWVRPTTALDEELRPCLCVQQPDCDKYLVWNMGNGRMICYTMLIDYLHLYRTSGLPINAFYASRSDMFTECAIVSDLSYELLRRSICGFFYKLEFPEDTFICPNCKTNPKYLVIDGKGLGPTKEAVKHLISDTGDDIYLTQSTQYKDRTFLSDPLERKHVNNLLTEQINMESFVRLGLTSPNGGLIVNLIERLNQSWNMLPKAYSRLIRNISIPTSVAGLIQVTHKKPLDILKAFCRKEIDLLSVRYIPSLKLVQEQMPPFWNILNSIIKLEESSQYLPKDVAAITLKLLEIRYLTLRRATQRDLSLYHEWTSEKSHPCIFCP